MKFYQLDPEQRRSILKKENIQLAPIEKNELNRLNNLSENVVGAITLPLGVVENLIVNDQSYWVPMATEEPSVVAAANHGAKIFALNSGAKCQSIRNGIYGQIVLKVDKDFELEKLSNQFPTFITQVNKEFASLVHHGGGCKQITAKKQDNLVYLKVLVDPAEAMGANKTNAILEYLSKLCLKISGVEEKLFAILSNYPSQMTTAKVKLDLDSVGGRQVAEKIALLSEIGMQDPFRGTTNNKGIMNGVDSVLIATGNDYRAIEAATSYLTNLKRNSLSTWKVESNYLVGQLTLPMPIGTVGGSINAREDIKQSFSILKGVSSRELANIIVTIGLANNLTALLAISTKGIQAGHMKLQARNLVANLDASPKEKSLVLQELIDSKKYTLEYAQKILEKIKGKGK